MKTETVYDMTVTELNGWFHYGPERKIRLYFADETLKPETSGRIIIIERKDRIFRRP